MEPKYSENNPTPRQVPYTNTLCPGRPAADRLSHDKALHCMLKKKTDFCAPAHSLQRTSPGGNSQYPPGRELCGSQSWSVLDRNENFSVPAGNQTSDGPVRSLGTVLIRERVLPSSEENSNGWSHHLRLLMLYSFCTLVYVGKVKVKVTLEQDTNAQKDSRCIALIFLQPRPRPPCPAKEPVPIVQEAGWAPGPVWKGAGNLASPGFDPWTVQPVASRYTD